MKISKSISPPPGDLEGRDFGRKSFEIDQTCRPGKVP